jgi:microcystin-dependent protein
MKINVYTIDIQLPRWLKRAIIFGAIPATVLLGTVHYLRADVAIPNTFADGDTLSAAKVNANFAVLQGGINTLASTVSSTTVPPGTVVAFAGPTVPAGWLPCDGKQYNALESKYVALYSAIGTLYGGNSSASVFSVPDLRGVFLRGWDNKAGRDPDASTRAAAAGGLPGDAVGSLQGDSFKSHDHGAATGTEMNFPFRGIWYDDGGYNTAVSGSSGLGMRDTVIQGGSHNHAIGAQGGQETRPANVAVNYIIKY